ncbi:hypothetical protein AX15_004679 [Amanita polypyramis BW_CC]|nr:hypothetical protein AX15_004679 [Amanita polypyramis BW_CC]
MCDYPVDQLVQLASHHPRSPYNCLKFGPNGSPYPYRPLSLHLPDQFRLLQLRHARAQHTQVWWLCRRSSPPPPAVPLFGPAGAQNEIPALQSDILAAIVEPMTAAPALATTVRTSASHPLNISPIIPPDLVSFISSRLSVSTTPTLFTIPPSLSLDALFLTFYSRNTRSYPGAIDYNLHLPLPESLESSYHDSHQSPEASFLDGITHVLDPLTNGDMTPPNENGAPVKQPASLGLLGNFLLSSCPGKKVRLDGPVGGRHGVYRDIDADLRRIKDLGVGCIICCLDDEELSSLGIPWSNYESSARDIGIDILRLASLD